MGFESKFEEEDYLVAVRRAQTVSDTKVAERLGVARTTVYRYRKANPKIYAKAKKMLEEKTSLAFNRKTKPTTEDFAEIPIVKDWIDLCKKRRVSEKVIRSRVSQLNNVCYELNTHPEKLTVDRVADFVMKVRDLEDNGEEQKIPDGCKFLYIRKGIRSFFMLAKGVSAQVLTAKGIDAGRSKGTGSMARERITQEQRHEFEKHAKRAVIKTNQELNTELSLEEVNNRALELVALAQFMYYTASRISATLAIKMNDEKHKFAFEDWEIHILDKGKKGGQHWQKRLRGDALEKMQNYIEARHNIPKDEQSLRLPDMDKPLFPSFSEDYNFERIAMKYALRYAGVNAKMQNHIWRHTFAQDWLHASDWNYELGAAIGGWTSTDTMKLCYGKMSIDAVTRGLKRAMGEHVPDVTYKLLW